MAENDALGELRAADAAYHAVCIDIQEPDVPLSEPPLRDIEAVAARLIQAARQLREQAG